MSDTIVEMKCQDCDNRFWVSDWHETEYKNQIICPIGTIQGGSDCTSYAQPTGRSRQVKAIP